jgi:hypothetical protein
MVLKYKIRIYNLMSTEDMIHPFSLLVFIELSTNILFYL